jgi:hypothetical protein
MRPLSGSSPVLLSLAALLIAGCDNQRVTGVTKPVTGAGSTVFADRIGVSDLSTLLGAGTTRIAVRVIPGTLTAAKVVVRQGDQTGRPERISSEVTGLAIGGGTDTLTLALGAIQVTFDATTSFQGWSDEHDDDDSAAVGEAGFISALQAALAAGHHPTVVALRQPPTTPQGPNDSSFFASVLRLDDAADHPSLELNVTQANLLINSAPPPDAWLTLLGRQFELRVSDSTTTIVQHTPRTEGALHFEGRVIAVDTGAQTVTLADSTVLHVVSGTEFEHPCGDHDGAPLQTLAAVNAALAAGDTVDAAGEGLLTSSAPRTLDLIEVRFRIRNGMEHEPFVVEFEGLVTAADSVGRTFTLGDGTVVTVTDSTYLIAHDSLTSLGAVAQALAATTPVPVSARGLATQAGPGALTALLVRFRVGGDGGDGDGHH